MAKKFNQLREKMSPERRGKNEAEARAVLLEMTLQEIRQSVTSYSQEDIAEMLEVTQGYVSRLERQGDMPLSRLYAYVQALGGQLEIKAKFRDQEITIPQFADLAKLKGVLEPEHKKKSA